MKVIFQVWLLLGGVASPRRLDYRLPQETCHVKATVEYRRTRSGRGYAAKVP